MDNPPKRITAERAFLAFLLLACAGLGVLSLLLARENDRLERENVAIAMAARRSGFVPGDRLSSLVPAPPQGGGVPAPDLLTLEDGRAGTLMFIVGGGCGLCRALLPSFEALASPYADSTLITLVLELSPSTEGKGPIADATTLPVTSAADANTTWLVRTPAIPTMLLLDEHGAVVDAWVGGFDDEQIPQIAERLEAFYEAAHAPPG